MEQEIRCSSCGAHLQYQTDTPDKCTYCGSRVRFPNQDKNLRAQVPNTVKPVVIIIVVVIVVIMGSVGVFISSVVGTVDKAVNINIPAIPTTVAGSQEEPSSAFAEEVLRFGGEGNGIGKFDDNRSVVIDGQGNIYCTDYAGGRVQIFDKNGKFIKQWANDLQYIPDMCVSRDGIVYMISGSKITSFEGSSGKKLKTSTEVFFSHMTMTADDNILATTSTGGLYKLDKNLVVLEASRNFMQKGGMSNNMSGGIACNGFGEIFILDLMGQHVHHFSSKWEFLDKFKTKASSANDIEIDSKGRIFISATNTIYVYDDEGEFVESFPTKQTFGMAFDDDGGLWTASRPYVVKYKIKQ